MIEVKKYDLPDLNLIDDQEKDTGYFLWIPDDYYIVLGNSNKPKDNLNYDHIFTDDIQVYKRPSGGETVILTPNTLVIAVKLTLEKFLNPSLHFQYFNNKIIEGLETLGVENVFYKGISDIAVGEKKILGSSIYRKKRVLFYHAVLNLAEPVETIERYIKHPTKEPDYRKGRSHKEFVTSLYDEGYFFTFKQIKNALSQRFDTISEEEVKILSQSKY
jgi:lipoate-protein ligase A